MIGWGMIGCGNVTEVKSGPAFQQASRSRLVGVMRRTGALAEDYARRHQVPHWFTDAEALIVHPEVDAVYIATPPGSHCDYAEQVCAAGKPAYVEKPMARNYAECARMVEAFESAGIPLFVAYYRRGLPRFKQVRAMLEEGRIGAVTGVAYRYSRPSHRNTDFADLPWRLQARDSGGGFLLDLGSHTLDALDFLLGPLEQATGLAANVASPCEVEDSVAMCFRTSGGALGTASWNFASGVVEDLIEITGVDGRISLSTFGEEPIRLESDGGIQTIDLPNPRPIQLPLIQTVVDALHGEGACPSIGRTAARTSLVMDSVLSSYYGSRADAFWERPETWSGRPSTARRY